MKAFVLRGLHSYTLEIYRGHKPRQISDVEWVHYLDRLQLDPEGVEAMFREQIVGPLDEILEPLRVSWKRVLPKDHFGSLRNGCRHRFSGF